MIHNGGGGSVSKEVTVSENEILEIISLPRAPLNMVILLSLPSEAGEVRFSITEDDVNGVRRASGGNFYYHPPLRHIFGGPCRLQFRGSQSEGTVWGALTYKITPKQSSTFQERPSNTVVIPADSAGPVEIIMESSEDMINWTRTEPGTYGTSTAKRFFRIRAVRK